MISFSRGARHSTQAGFTLIEMLIVLAIIGLLSTVVIFQYQLFNSQLLLRNLAYEIALTIREAQTLGVSVRGVNGTFSTAYGVHFEPGTAYLVFRDDNGNSRFDAGDTTLSRYTIERRNEIVDLCVGSAPLSGGECGNSSLDVIFLRPDPDAIFYPTGSDAQITLGPMSDTNTRTVSVTATGQVSVQ